MRTSDQPRIVKNCEAFLRADASKILSRHRVNLDFGLTQGGLEGGPVKLAESMQMKLSIQKCQLLKIGRDPWRSSAFSVLRNGLSVCNVVNDVVILVDSWLGFDDHCRSVIRKASNVMDLIPHNFECRDVDFLKRIFCSYVLPITDYGCALYQAHTVKNIKLRLSPFRSGLLREFPVP